METSPASRLTEETAAWCDEADRFVQSPSHEPRECLDVVRGGIFLRRRWDRLDRESPVRRRLLGLLAAAQNICHAQLAEGGSEEGTLPSPERVEHIIRRLAEDDHYLAALLDDETLSRETAAFAIECFRDDLHWLGTLVALLDGRTGVDFTGRVLLEQASVQRQHGTSQDGRQRNDPALDTAAQRLRHEALAQRIRSLIDQPDADNLEGWWRAWRSASRLAMRPRGATDADLEEALAAYRIRAVACWKQLLSELPAAQRDKVLVASADRLSDAVSEALTFMEDLSLDEAISSLKTLSEDAKTCLKAAKEFGGEGKDTLVRRLARRRKGLAAELQERRLGWRLERLMGHRAVVAMERLMFLLLVLFMGMLIVEEAYDRNQWPGVQRVIEVCAWLDLGICVCFLSEFTLKFSLATPRWLYLKRNWLTGLLPSIPFGFMIYLANRPDIVEAAEMFVMLRWLRYLRLVQSSRWLRFARPLVRVARLVGFVLQASDRLVRGLAPLLNRNLLLFERASVHVEQPEYRTALSALRERFRYRASEVADDLSEAERAHLAHARIEDLTAMLSGPSVPILSPTIEIDPSSSAREIPLDHVVSRLLSATPASVSDRIGRAMAQSVARWCRVFDVMGVRRLPVFRELVTAGRRPSPYGTTAQVANYLGALLRSVLDRIYWMADLHGTVTAPQLVDSVGEWMVKGTARPARRLILISLAFVVILGLASLLPSETLRSATHALQQYIGVPLFVLGGVCLVVAAVGLWFRQIAGEATDFGTQVAEAQFLSATKNLRQRLTKQHEAVLHHRVIEPEQRIEANTGQGSDARESQSAARRTVDLLLRDYLDAAPFHRSDTKTTTQLLGNLALVSLRETRLGYSRRRKKRLRRLDLATARSKFRGPYLWFHFISRSLSQQTAKLVVDYNANALPLDRAAVATDAEIARYVGWLAQRLRIDASQLTLPQEFAGRHKELFVDSAALGHGDPSGKRQESHGHGRVFHGTDFTAIHFLSADAELEADVRRRYGDQVADLVRRDRRDNIRRVFRTYPFHHWPKEQRTLNLLNLYNDHCAGGRVLFLPFRLVFDSMLLLGRAARLMARFVGDVLHPTVGNVAPIDDPDPFVVAVRKIHRMRQPVFLECLRMRAEFDPEYLGVVPPGVEPGAPQTNSAPFEEDLGLINADPAVLRELRALAAARRLEMADFRRHFVSDNSGSFAAESLRAAAMAYAIDYRRVRTYLDAESTLREAFGEALYEPPPFSWSVRAWWCRMRNRRRLRRLFDQPAFEEFSGPQKKHCLRSICLRRGELLRSMRTLTHHRAPSDPVSAARAVLCDAARDPATWTQQLVVLRAVQTLSVLDLKTYCDLVAELGEYSRVGAPSEMPGPSEASASMVS